jgi:hypothetical protein
MNLTEKDLLEIKKKGISPEQVQAQVNRIKNGMSHSNLVSAATIGKGIEKYDETGILEFISSYEKRKDVLSIVKFVPASGAATRMFKFLFQFLNNFDASKESVQGYIKRQNDILIQTFISNLEKFPFYDEVVSKMKQNNLDIHNLSEDEKYVAFVKNMLSEELLNYSFYPKGLLPFHKYKDGVATAFQEHLFESTLYASSNGHANLHFTVSEKHQDFFNSEFEKIKKSLEQKTSTKFDVSYSYQKESTETVALTGNGSIYRNEDNSILFRPGGHGALLENLNELDNDIIFIKNIDNIVVSDKNIQVSEYKKLLTGILLSVQETVFKFLGRLDSKETSSADFKIMALFLVHRLNIAVPLDFDKFIMEEQRTYLKEKLNRPIRVCGMVKNQGEPGGGPFWVKDENDNISLQIVEFAQINFQNKEQQGLVYKATHFNPTDLVCGVKDYKGKKFNLLDFVDPEAAFITMKTQNGTDIKALELPGLWNGSMAYWNSIFVEVPLETFNPVKTVNDLLKPEHQACDV